MTFAAAGPVALRLSPYQTTPRPSATLDVVRTHVRRAPERARPAIRTSGWLGDSADAMTRALTWNTIYAPDLGRVLTPTSRDFVCREREGFYGQWALHLGTRSSLPGSSAWLDPAYAEGIFDQIIEQATPSGMLPNRVSDDKGRTDDRSQPPVGAYTVLKAYLGSGLTDATRRHGAAADQLSGAESVARLVVAGADRAVRPAGLGFRPG